MGLSNEVDVYQVCISKSCVKAHWKLTIYQDGTELVTTNDVTLYFKDSDWSEAEPLVQKACQLAFQELWDEA